jgi:hypothetical protein
MRYCIHPQRRWPASYWKRKYSTIQTSRPQKFAPLDKPKELLPYQIIAGCGHYLSLAKLAPLSFSYHDVLFIKSVAIKNVSFDLKIFLGGSKWILFTTHEEKDSVLPSIFEPALVKVRQLYYRATLSILMDRKVYRKIC